MTDKFTMACEALYDDKRTIDSLGQEFGTRINQRPVLLQLTPAQTVYMSLT